MKVVKIFTLIFALALTVSSCEKSNVKPRCPHEKQQETESPSNPTGRISSATAENTVDTGEDQIDPLFIVGSGDDDRDGGDKKAKAGGR